MIRCCCTGNEFANGSLSHGVRSQKKRKQKCKIFHLVRLIRIVSFEFAKGFALVFIQRAIAFGAIFFKMFLKNEIYSFKKLISVIFVAHKKSVHSLWKELVIFQL